MQCSENDVAKKTAHVLVLAVVTAGVALIGAGDYSLDAWLF